MKLIMGCLLELPHNYSHISYIQDLLAFRNLLCFKSQVV